LQKATKIWINAELVDRDNARIHVLTHALHRATAIFEGIRCYKTDRGAAVFGLYDHIWRLIKSGKIYLMDLPYNAAHTTNPNSPSDSLGSFVLVRTGGRGCRYVERLQRLCKDQFKYKAPADL